MYCLTISDSKEFKFIEGTHVGQEVRSSWATVQVNVYPYSQKKWAEMGQEINNIVAYRADHTSSGVARTVPVKTKIGDIPTYVLWSGLIGEYFRADFHNEDFIYSMSTESSNFSDLAKGILATWQGAIAK